MQKRSREKTIVSLTNQGKSPFPKAAVDEKLNRRLLLRFTFWLPSSQIVGLDSYLSQ